MQSTSQFVVGPVQSGSARLSEVIFHDVRTYANNVQISIVTACLNKEFYQFLTSIAFCMQ